MQVSVVVCGRNIELFLELLIARYDMIAFQISKICSEFSGKTLVPTFFEL